MPTTDDPPAPRATSSPPSRASRAPSSRALALAALGIVFGDIGTSPLYAFKQSFVFGHGVTPTPVHVLGILSLVFWSLTGVVCVKYVGLILRADYEGEGGTLALLALIRPPRVRGIPPTLTAIALVVIFGSGMLFGDGVITPAISVLSAVEGLNVGTTVFEHVTVPITIAILVGLFAIQRRGTASIGGIFGPIMAAWFVTIAATGLVAVVAHPSVLAALNPAYAVGFFAHGGPSGVLIMGAIVLCVSGVEALYADLGHFGRVPIALAWYALVFPALLLNYFGQGATVIANPKSLSNPFYLLFPSWSLYPAIVLATIATIIASQALISGAFSLTEQAVQLGYAPRVRVVHTSRDHSGQIYLPLVNAVLGIGCIVMVAAFHTSDALGAAYGLSVTGTMLATSFTYFAVARRSWGWPLWRASMIVGFFLFFDLSFFVGNLPKIVDGGWVPLAIATMVFVVSVTWFDGRRRLAMAMAEQSVPIDEFVAKFKSRTIAGPQHTAVFLTPYRDAVPFGRTNRWLRREIFDERIILMTIVSERRPYVRSADRMFIERLGPELYRVDAHFGFLQQPRISLIAPFCERSSELGPFSDPFYFLAHPKVVHDERPGAMPRWQRALYDFLIHAARPYTDSLELPPDRVVEIGIEVRV